MSNPKYLNQRCLLCENTRVRYLKTKGGFYKVCDSCREVLGKADLTEPELRVFAVEANSESPGDGES